MTEKYKTIRIKMKKAGKVIGSRLQRVQVLASGKFKFVKNLSRSRSNAPRHKTKTRSVRTTVRRYGRKRHGGGRSMTAGFEKAAKGVALFGPAALHAMNSGIDAHQKAVFILRDYTGINVDHGGKWEPHNLVNGWGPFVGITVASKIAHKVIGLVRRL